MKTKKSLEKMIAIDRKKKLISDTVEILEIEMQNKIATLREHCKVNKRVTIKY